MEDIFIWNLRHYNKIAVSKSYIMDFLPFINIFEKRELDEGEIEGCRP